MTLFPSLAKISEVPESERDDDSWLSLLPVATATPESATVTRILPIASTVVRIRSSQVLTDRSACLISVKVYKPDAEAKLGIRLSLNNEGHLRLARVDGLMKESPLRAGDELLRINGQDVSAWTTTKALHYLRESCGWLNLTVRNPNSSGSSLALASIRKSVITDKLGISFCKVANKLTVHSLNVAGLLGGRTTIRMGDIVESINSISCAHLDSATTVNIIRSLPDWVNILVRKPALRECDGNTVIVAPVKRGALSLTFNDDECSEEYSAAVAEATEVVHPLALEEEEDDFVEPALISVTLTKVAKSEKLGLSLVRVDDVIYIKKVSGSTLLGQYINKGMMLLAINHKPTCSMSVLEACNYIRDRVGSITLLARNPHGSPKYCRAVALKKTAERQNLIGVSFKGSSGRQLKLCEIRQNGLFAYSALNVGDSVVKINDIRCSHCRPKEAVDLVRSGEEIVSILVKSKSKMGVVVGKLSMSKV